jgi:hypothetical protein
MPVRSSAESKVSLAVFDAACGAPVIRRDARTTIITLNNDDRMHLAHELLKETAYGGGVLLVLEDDRDSPLGRLADRYE